MFSSSKRYSWEENQVKRWGWWVTNATTLPLAPKLGFIPVTILSVILCAIRMFILASKFFCSPSTESHCLIYTWKKARESETEAREAEWEKVMTFIIGSVDLFWLPFYLQMLLISREKEKQNRACVPRMAWVWLGKDDVCLKTDSSRSEG